MTSSGKVSATTWLGRPYLCGRPRPFRDSRRGAALGIIELYCIWS
jgi:hypothetical protein